jgi:hypothetical protein
MPNLYDELSRRCFGFNRDIIKRTLVMHCYRAEGLDPWVVHIIQTELRDLKLEYLSEPSGSSPAYSTPSTSGF